MKKVDDTIIEKILDMCKYIKWKNVEDFNLLNEEKNNERNKKPI